MPTAPSPELLMALSCELAGMVGTVESLSVSVADHVRSSQGEARTRALIDAQAIDELSQRLDALSAVTAALAKGADEATALSAVRLGDLAQRLSGAPFNPPDRAVGDITLFE
jgi:hypothetical protein